MGIRSVTLAVVLAALSVSGHAFAQSDTDVVLRLNRAEQQVRELTGQLEQLQFRNQQLEQQLRALQGGAPVQQQSAAPQAQQPLPPLAAQPAPQAAPQAAPQIARTDSVPARRPDVFDPSLNPNAPGVPRQLGGTAAVIEQEPDIGAPGGRAAGAPLDLSTLATAPQAAPQAAPMPPQQPPPPLQQQLPPAPPARSAAVTPTLPPSQTPKDEFDLGYGYVLRKDYALAEDTLRGFLQKYASDPLAVEAQYWLGESLFQRQRYRDAAESFLKVTTSYGNAPARGAEGLLRLGQSLAALNEREAACAAFGEVARKYPRASAGVKQSVDREQKRVRC